MWRRNRPAVDAPAPHRAVADLTGRLVGRLADPHEDLACSGLGLWCALAVLASGASGATAEELVGLLGLDPGDDVAEHLDRLDAEVAALAGTAHALAVWSRVPTYRAWRERLPAVGFAHLDDDADLDAWVRDHTDGMVERLPVAIDARTLLVLVDALCLDARWATTFPEWNTEDRAFAAPGGDRLVPTMSVRTPATNAGEVGTTTIVDVPAEPGDGGRVVLRLGLGHPAATPADVLADVLAGGAAQRRGLGADQVDLFLPRFAIRDRHDLVPVLEALGAGRVLTDLAELDRLSPEPLKVSQAVQEAVVDVDEEGVRAAAVTAMALLRAAGAPSRPPTVVEVRFDRPFAFALVAEASDLPLFAGWVADPSPPPG